MDLTVNGAPIGTLTADRCEQRTCVFEDVSLTQGANTVVATGNHAGTSVSDTVEWTLSTQDVNIAAGRLATGLTTQAGALFGSDEFFVGGDTDFVKLGANEFGEHLDLGDDPSGGDPAVEGTDDPMLFKYYRFGDFGYDIPLPDGTYAVTLGFVEPDEDAEVGDRVFSVTANGQTLEPSLDILAEAGAPLTALTKTYMGPVTGGRLLLEFASTEGDALVSNIKIIRQ